VLVVFLVATVFFARFALRLEQKTTLKDLLPDHNEVVMRFEETVIDFDLVDRVAMVVQFEPDDLVQAEAFADIFVDQIRQDPEFPEYLQWMNANLFDQIDETNYYEYLRFITRFLPEEKLDAFARSLSPENIRARIKQNYRDLESGMASKTFIQKDPLFLIDLAANYRDEITGNYSVDVTDGYLVSKDKTMLLVLGKPLYSPEDVDYSVALWDFLHEHLALAKQAFVEEEEFNPDDSLSVNFTGAHPITACENKLIRGDVIAMFISSFAMVMLLFVLAYGRPMALVYVGLPLLSAEVWTLGIGYLLFGRLNLLTATFSAVIVGLGIDYAIHIFSRYLDERTKGLDSEESMKLALSETGLGTLVGGTTTALAFLAMGFNSFHGLVEFASIAAIGILMCLVQMFVLLPSLLFVRDKMRGRRPAFTRAQHDFKVEKLIMLALKHRRLVTAVIVVGTVLLGWQAIHLQFNADIRSIRARSNEAIKLQSLVTEKVGGSLRSLTFVLEAKDEADLHRAQAKLDPVLAQLQREGSLVRYDNALSFVQSPERQMENLAYLRERVPSGDELKRTFFEALEQEGFRITEDNRSYIDFLAQAVDANEPASIRQLLQGSENVLGHFLYAGPDRFKAVNYLYPVKGLWEKDATARLIQRIEDAVDLGPDQAFYVTGIQMISNELKTLIQQSFEVSCLIAIFFVFVTLMLHFRRWSLVFLTLTPLLVSVIWMLGTLRLLGIDIHVLNFVATPIIIGIGIDDGVHVVEKYLHRVDTSIGSLIAKCAKAVTLTSLTTIFGFSSLFLADYSGFRSLGLSSILGVFYCWLGSVVLLPIIMASFNLRFVRKVVEPVDLVS